MYFNCTDFSKLTRNKDADRVSGCLCVCVELSPFTPHLSTLIKQIHNERFIRDKRNFLCSS